jgi:hypothetical protein
MEKAVKMDKGQWQRPHLVILARSKPEEAVLHACKLNTTGFGSGASGTVDRCYTTDSGGICLTMRCEGQEAS